MGATIYTYAFATWLDSGAGVPFGFPASFVNDVEVLGHEVAEWMNDPFITSQAPPWQSSVPPIPPKACSNVIEAGDGLQQFNSFTVPLSRFTYHLRDLQLLLLVCATSAVGGVRRALYVP